MYCRKCLWIILVLLVGMVSGSEAQTLGEVMVGRWELIQVNEKNKDATTKHTSSNLKWLEFHHDGNLLFGNTDRLDQNGTYSLKEEGNEAQLLMNGQTIKTIKSAWISEGLLVLKDLDYPKKGALLCTYRAVEVAP